MPGDLILAIDTSGPRLQLALADAQSVDTHVEDLARGHAEILFDRIAALLARNSRTYADLTRIAVTTGPGSFTGLRIGLSAARGLGLALGVPVLGIPTLYAMSLSLPKTGPNRVVVDAKRGEAYTQDFAAPGRPASDAVLRPASEARAGGRHIEADAVDIALMARFAPTADPGDFPPAPVYIRPADAKPQDGARIPRAPETTR